MGQRIDLKTWSMMSLLLSQTDWLILDCKRVSGCFHKLATQI